MGQFTISGKVVNQNGEPLYGADVFIKDAQMGTVTDHSGSFKLSGIRGKVTVAANFIGHSRYNKYIELTKNVVLNIKLYAEDVETDEIIISSTRANSKSPIAYTNLDKNELRKQNTGRDIPFILGLTPSVVQSSDAGAGIGYTSLSIRGTDATRINVTVNDIPLNDSESHGVWWVNMPDFASSVNNIQVQRGVGTSTNGAGAFGASINFRTESFIKKAYAEINSTVGSFNTLKNTVKVGTGLIKDRYNFDVRLSQVHSDGFVDRAQSDLKSFYINAGMRGEFGMLELNVYSGLEETYQAWNGVPKVRLESDEAGMQQYLDHWLYSETEYNQMLASAPRTYNYYTYKNEVDHYNQTHAHLIWSNSFTENLSAKVALHYTRGKGYYEQFKVGDDFADYGIANPVVEFDETTSLAIESSDIIRRKWLDNHFVGATYALDYTTGQLNLVVGGSANQYLGGHYGNVIWSEYGSTAAKDFEWYHNNGTKTEVNTYAKANYEIGSSLNIFADLQYRYIDYKIEGIHDDLRDISREETYPFINPKAGLLYEISKEQQVFASVAVANREPSRSEFRDIDENYKPVPENLIDYELGYKLRSNRFAFEANAYYMDYKNQLVLTGQINNVGSAVKRNVADSYRAGIELAGAAKITDQLVFAANLTLSQNKILGFTEYVDNWDTWEQDATDLGTTDIAFSPNVIANANLSYSPVKNLSFDWYTKFVGKQYIDNSSNDARALDAYLVNDLGVSYSLPLKALKAIDFSVKVNNLLNEEYETYAWVYSYSLGGERYEMDGYFPQAGTNWLASVSFRF